MKEMPNIFLHSDKKEEHKDELFESRKEAVWWGVRGLRCAGVGVKKFTPTLKAQGKQSFRRGYPGNFAADISKRVCALLLAPINIYRLILKLLQFQASDQNRKK